jgi:hypothetical protein
MAALWKINPQEEAAPRPLARPQAPREASIDLASNIVPQVHEGTHRLPYSRGESSWQWPPEPEAHRGDLDGELSQILNPSSCRSTATKAGHTHRSPCRS